jgi:hypothetical protein
MSNKNPEVSSFEILTDGIVVTLYQNKGFKLQT